MTTQGVTGLRVVTGGRLHPPTLSRTGWVLEQIRRDILSGEFISGQPLVEADLAAMYGVSKTPVREALKTLAGRGLVDLGDFKGATVTRVDLSLVDDVFGTRLLLEPPAVAASVRAGVDLHSAKKLLDAASDATEAADRSDFNREFHRVLYASAGNRLLIELLDGMRERTALISVTLWRAADNWDAEVEEHVALWEAASRGNAEEAARLTHEHIEQFAARNRALLSVTPE